MRKTATVVMAVVGAWVAGCQMTPAPGFVNCPLPVVEQTLQVLEIAPLGTARDEAMKRLKTAGIGGDFGENRSIYYCDYWKRSDRESWHINVVLLFDEQGKLYKTRPDLTETGRTSAGGASELPARSRVGNLVDPFE